MKPISELHSEMAAAVNEDRDKAKAEAVDKILRAGDCGTSKRKILGIDRKRKAKKESSQTDLFGSLHEADKTHVRNRMNREGFNF